MKMLNSGILLLSLATSILLCRCGNDDSGENWTANLSGSLIEGIEYDCAGKAG